MEIVRTFSRPEKVSADQWRFMLNAWMAGFLIVALASSFVAIAAVILVWSVVPKAIGKFGWTTGFLLAASPLLVFPMSAALWWMFLSSLRTSRRFPPTG